MMVPADDRRDASERVYSHQISSIISVYFGLGCNRVRYVGTDPLVRIRANITSACYVNDIIPPFALSYLKGVSGVIFQHNNATPHFAAARVFFRGNSDPLLPWSSKSQDLSNVSDMVKRQLRRYDRPPVTLGELWTRISKYHLDGYTQKNIKTSLDSTPRRAQQVIHARGGHTDY